MKQVEGFFGAHLLASVAALAIAYALGAQIAWSFVFVFLGGLWFYAHLRDGHGFETILFFAYAVAAAVGFWLQLPSLLLLLAVVAALGAWDLDHFIQRLRLIQRVDLTTGLAASHLRRLGVVELLGALAGVAALTSSLHLPFWVQLLLVVLVIIVLSRLVILVRRDLGE